MKNFYTKNEAYLKPVFKFLLAFIVFIMINAKLGYMERLDSIVVVLVAGFAVLAVLGLGTGQMVNLPLPTSYRTHRRH